MLDWIKRKLQTSEVSDNVDVEYGFTTDMHSHLLPGIDDGSSSMEESVEMIRTFAELGYTRLITTPHIMGDFYRNTPAIIRQKLEEVRVAVQEAGLSIQLDAAAEYYLDEQFIEKINRNEPLLTFGDRYLLFETPFINEPSRLQDCIFLLKAAGYQPVLAHPERYAYLYNNFNRLEEIVAAGALLQINTLSFGGYYSQQAQKIAEKIVQAGLVNFLGTDCHKPKHLEALSLTIRKSKTYKQALRLNLLNRSI
jgi:protein-tyrosine phosphatase